MTDMAPASVNLVGFDTTKMPSGAVSALHRHYGPVSRYARKRDFAEAA